MRADKFLANRFSSRTKASEEIERGRVLVNGKTIRPKDDVKETDEIVILQDEATFVSNGGHKLMRAKERFSLDFTGLVCVDIGASTGGFTDCLLQGDAKKVYAVDVGVSQLDERISTSEKVVVMDHTNARYLQKEDFLEKIDLVVTDVSFISLRLIFPSIATILGEPGEAIVLVKPQFESEGKHIGKSGIVHTSAHVKIVEKVFSYALENGLYPHAIVNAPVRKNKNVEYVVRLKKQPCNQTNKLLQEVEHMVKDYSLGILE